MPTGIYKRTKPISEQAYKNMKLAGLKRRGRIVEVFFIWDYDMIK